MMTIPHATVLYDSDCGLCTQVKNTVEALDWLGTMSWIPSRSPEAAAFRIPIEQLDRAVYIVHGPGCKAGGWRAVKRMLARLPLTYVLAAAAIRKSWWSAVAIAALFSPAFNPIGDRAYNWVAKNRSRLPSSTCALPIWDNQGK